MLVLLSLVVVGGLAGCGKSGDQTTSVDPQVLQDVIDAAFMVPGPEVRRAMRVQEFGKDKAIQECGGKPGPIDGTANRFNQSRYADLELIRERGLTEDEAGWAEDKRLDEIGAKCEDLAPDFASQKKWESLGGPWDDIGISAEQDPKVVAEYGDVAKCLSKQTGLEVTSDNPIISYLNAVNIQRSSDKQAISDEALSAAYADCAKPYFETLRELLLSQRDAMVERHREVLEAYAADIVEAGYVP